MEELLGLSVGRITAHLADSAEESASPDLVRLINENIQPPADVTEQDVLVRSMYIVSDQVNSFGGRFPREEHQNLCRLLVDSPVLVGHRKDMLPVARTFHAVCLDRNGESWVRSYFYWIHNGEKAEQFRDNIDGGIYKECSIGFTYEFPECSICGEDIRGCKHEPLQTYMVNGSEVGCHFNYRKVDRVLETSLVYRGATPDTSVSRELTIHKEAGPASNSEDLISPTEIDDLSELADASKFLVVPHYEGISVQLRQKDGRLVVCRPDGSVIDGCSFTASDKGFINFGNVHRARLVGFRGKERCPIDELDRYLVEKKGPVSRLTLFVYPPGDSQSNCNALLSSDGSIKWFRHRFTNRAGLSAAAKELQTRLGVEIRPIAGSEQAGTSYLWKPEQATIASDGSYCIETSDQSKEARLSIAVSRGRESFVLRRFNLMAFQRGARFMADRVEAGSIPERSFRNTCCSGALYRLEEKGAGLIGQTAGALAGLLVIRPAILNGRSRFIVYNTPSQQQQNSSGTRSI